MNIKNIVVKGLVALALVGIGYFAHDAMPSFGAVTGQIHYQMEQFAAGLKVGDRNATETKWVANGTCNLNTAVTSFAASSTAQYTCAVTGVQSGDLVIADLPAGAGTNGSGSGSLGAGFMVVAAYATTSNQIGVTLANFTGAATSSYAQATTTVEYRVVR